MKIKKFQTGGFNDVISSYMSQQYPNLTNPTTQWFNQSLLNSAPNIFAGGKKNFSTNLTDPKSQFKYQYPAIQPGFDTGLMTQKLNVPQSAAWAGTKTGAGTEGGLKNFLSKNAKGFSTAGQVASIGSALLGPTNSDSTTQAINSGYDVVSDAIMAVPGWGTAIGGAMKVAGFASDALNKLTGGATTVEDSKFGLDKVLSSKFLTLTPVGLANALGKSKIEGSNTDIAKTINYGYTPEDEVKKTQIGGVTKLFNKIFKKKNVKKEAEQKVLNTNIQNIKKSAVVGANSQWQQAVQNSYANTAERNQQQLMGGFGINQLRTLAAKNGTKLYKLGNIKNEVKNKRNKTKKLQTGGTLNVIPEGAFHSRKNNIDLEGITPKGIPVITLEDGGGVTQHAEIERAELIFRKELTDKVEEAYKKYKDGDESVLLEIGKLLTYEILENTEDNVGLLNDK